MKKLTAGIFAAVFVAALYAYNPPVSGEDLNFISSPSSLSGANTVTGGALFNAKADSIIVNPALSAKEQRVNLDAGYTFLYSTLKEYNAYNFGTAIQTGILIPFKLYVFTGYLDFVSSPFYEMNLGNSFDFKAGLSKEISEKLDVGLSASGGVAWLNDNDWSLCANVGAVYHFGNLGFISDFRLGASALNLGKVYNKLSRIGIDRRYENGEFPTFPTFKIGVAGSLLDTEIVKIGLAFDFTTPCFQNLIVDMNAQIAFNKVFVISIGEKFNLVENLRGHYSPIPSVAVLFNFNFNVRNNQYLENNGWSESEMRISTGYRNMYNTIHAVSAAVDVDLGMADEQPPEIVLWDNEE